MQNINVLLGNVGKFDIIIHNSKHGKQTYYERRKFHPDYGDAIQWTRAESGIYVWIKDERLIKKLNNLYEYAITEAEKQLSEKKDNEEVN